MLSQRNSTRDQSRVQLRSLELVAFIYALIPASLHALVVGADGWTMTARGVLNDAVSIYFLDAALARWVPIRAAAR